MFVEFEIMDHGLFFVKSKNKFKNNNHIVSSWSPQSVENY